MVVRCIIVADAAVCVPVDVPIPCARESFRGRRGGPCSVADNRWLGASQDERVGFWDERYKGASC